MKKEIEATFLSVDKDSTRAKLKKAGFELKTPEYMMRRKTFEENMREVWMRDGVEITIDTWPGLNPFVEIEGTNEKIVQEISNELGFDFGKAVFGSIDLVYEKEIGIPAETIIHLPEITFSNPPKKNAA